MWVWAGLPATSACQPHHSDTDTRTVLMGPTTLEPPREVNMAGDIVWEGPPVQNDKGKFSHPVDRLDNGNYLLLRRTESEFSSPTDTSVQTVAPVAPQ